MMHPYVTEALAEQRQQEVRRVTAESRRGPVRMFPRWQLSWSRQSARYWWFAAAGHRRPA
jgi:hypothetical protein